MQHLNVEQTTDTGETPSGLVAADGAPDESEAAAWWDDLQTIPHLKEAVLNAQKTDPSGSVILGRILRTIRAQPTNTLLHRLSVVEHPMAAWALHVELDARDVPPCLRPPMQQRSRQVEFIATLADLHWLRARYENHVTKFERLRGVFRYPLRDDRWHKAVLWAYRQCHGRRHVLATRLGLTDDMRCESLTMPNASQSRDRQLLRQGMSAFKNNMVRHALERPDKSGLTSPERVADRRALFVRTYVLLGRNQTATVDCLHRVFGVAISRQTLARQLQNAAATGEAERMVFGLL